MKMLTIYSLLILFYICPFSIFAQEVPLYVSPTKVRIQKPYIDASIGGVLAPGEGLGLNAHGGLGYQIKPFLGFGIGITTANDISDYNPKSFSGIGVEHRIDYKKAFFKSTLGVVINDDYNSDDEWFQYERIPGNSYWFYRGALGYKPSNGLINVGMVVHYSRGRYQRFYCENDCEATGTAIQRIFNPQFYFGLSLPKY